MNDSLHCRGIFQTTRSSIIELCKKMYSCVKIEIFFLLQYIYTILYVFPNTMSSFKSQVMHFLRNRAALTVLSGKKFLYESLISNKKIKTLSSSYISKALCFVYNIHSTFGCKRIEVLNMFLRTRIIYIIEYINMMHKHV